MNRPLRRLSKHLLLFTLLNTSALLWANPPLTLQTNGLEGPAQKNVTLRLQAVSQEINKPGQDPVIIQHAIEHIPSDIQQAIAPYGYFKPHIQAHHIRNAQLWSITYQVEPGPRIKVQAFTLEIEGQGAGDKAFIRLETHTGIAIDKPLNTEHYDALKERLFNLASQRGYFDAVMKKSEILIDLKTRTARITICFDTGKRYLFGETHFSKNALSPLFLERYLGYRKGQHYNSHPVENLRQNLINSNYFQMVDVNTSIYANEYTVPIQVKLTNKDSKHYIMGAGFGTDTGPRVLLGFNWVPVNQWGHQLNLNLKGAPRNNYYTATYAIPGKNPVTDQYALSAAYATEDVPRGQADSKSIGVSYSTAFRSWQETWMLRYLNERYNLTGLPRTHSDMVIPSINWTYLRTNKELNPTRGYKLDFNLAGALESLLSQESFFQATMSAKWLHTFQTHTRLLMRGMIGYTAIQDINNLPLSLQLLAGGTDSIRGYSYESIGPGQYATVGSVELQQRIRGDFYAAIFYDAGSISNQYLSDIQQGVGPALVYVSPIGDIELSVARPLDVPGNHWRIQFNMGPTL